jgi:oxalate decarboxylase
MVGEAKQIDGEAPSSYGSGGPAGRKNTMRSQTDVSASNRGPQNLLLKQQNPSSSIPPIADHGTVPPIWYSFELVHRRIQEGGWTHQITERELPSSKEIAAIQMRLTAGSYRELHWHIADEWSYILSGKARVTVLNPDGTMFIDDVEEGDLWLFPAGYPHSIQGLGDDGCEFLLVFNQGDFSEESTFLLSDWLAHTPPEVLAKNFRLSPESVAKLPTDSLYIFCGNLPESLEADIAEATADARGKSPSYTFKGRMTVFNSSEQSRTMDFNANDVGFVPAVAAQYIENTGETDLVFLEMFVAVEFIDFSLNNWIRHMPKTLAMDHLGLNSEEIDQIPSGKEIVL